MESMFILNGKTGKVTGALCRRAAVYFDFDERVCDRGYVTRVLEGPLRTGVPMYFCSRS